jgi:hypothetical protein
MCDAVSAGLASSDEVVRPPACRLTASALRGVLVCGRPQLLLCLEQLVSGPGFIGMAGAAAVEFRKEATRQWVALVTCCSSRGHLIAMLCSASAIVITITGPYCRTAEHSMHKPAAAHDHSIMPAHAHLNLLGWVSLFLFGIFYKLIPDLNGAASPSRISLFGQAALYR